METLQSLLVYIFWPRPPMAHHDNPKVIALLVLCGLLVVGSIAFSAWRRTVHSASFKRLSSSWSMAAFWFGFVGLVLTLARTEDVSVISMRLWWVVWVVSLVLYVFFQVKNFRSRHYEVLPKSMSNDPRAAYLPKKKR